MNPYHTFIVTGTAMVLFSFIPLLGPVIAIPEDRERLTTLLKFMRRLGICMIVLGTALEIFAP